MGCLFSFNINSSRINAQKIAATTASQVVWELDIEVEKIVRMRK